jgi:hypothetical protein
LDMAIGIAWRPRGAHAPSGEQAQSCPVAIRQVGRGRTFSVVWPSLLMGVLVILHGDIATAEGPPVDLILPLIATLTLGQSVLEVAVGGTTADRLAPLGQTVPRKPGFIPGFISIPDLYAVDVADREARRFAEPVDRSKKAALDLLPRSLSTGRALSLIYDTESLPAFRDSSRLLRLELEVDF